MLSTGRGRSIPRHRAAFPTVHAPITRKSTKCAFPHPSLIFSSHQSPALPLRPTIGPPNNFRKGENNEWRFHQVDGAEHFLRGDDFLLPVVPGAVLRYPFATSQARHAAEHHAANRRGQEALGGQ